MHTSNDKVASKNWPFNWSILFILFAVLNPSLCNAQVWTSLGQGANNTVLVLAEDPASNILYAAGEFVNADGKQVNCVAQWNGIEWDSLAGGANLSGGPNGCGTNITAMAVFQGHLYIAGDLFSGGGNDIGRWTGSTWDTILSDPQMGAIVSLYAHPDRLYALGTFGSINGVPANLIASWDGSSWSAIDNMTWDGGSRFIDMEFYQGELYVGGNFSRSDSGITNIAKFTGAGWEPVGAGFSGSFSDVNSLHLFNGKLLAGGFFTELDGNPGNGIASWDGSSWSSLGSGIGGVSFSRINDMTVHDGVLFAAGVFNSAGGIQTHQIASWDGLRWCGTGQEISNAAFALAEYDGQLILGGGFETIAGDSFNNIAAWDGGAFTQVCSEPETVFQASEATQDLAIFPNPTSGQCSLLVEALKPSSFSLIVQDIRGLEVLDRSGRLSSGENQLDFDLSDLPPGIYFVLMEMDGKMSIGNVVRHR